MGIHELVFKKISYFHVMKKSNFLFALLMMMVMVSCNRCKDDPRSLGGPTVYIKIVTDSTQERLNNLGAPSTVPAGHAALSPLFHKISAHYIEFTPNMYTALGAGEVVYHADETNAGGANAIDFAKARIAAPGEIFVAVPISSFTPGTYEYVRASLLYQNFVGEWIRFNGTCGELCWLQHVYHELLNQYAIGGRERRCASRILGIRDECVRNTLCNFRTSASGRYHSSESDIRNISNSARKLRSYRRLLFTLGYYWKRDGRYFRDAFFIYQQQF